MITIKYRKYNKNYNFKIMWYDIMIGKGNIVKDSEDDYSNNTSDDDFYFLDSIYIKSEYRNKGYGTKTLLLLLDKFGKYYLAPDSADSKRLYDRIGNKMPKKSEEYSRFGFAIDNSFGVYTIE